MIAIAIAIFDSSERSFHHQTHMYPSKETIKHSNLLIKIKRISPVKTDLRTRYLNGVRSVSYTHLDVYKRQV